MSETNWFLSWKDYSKTTVYRTEKSTPLLIGVNIQEVKTMKNYKDKISNLDERINTITQQLSELELSRVGLMMLKRDMMYQKSKEELTYSFDKMMREHPELFDGDKQWE